MQRTCCTKSESGKCHCCWVRGRSHVCNGYTQQANIIPWGSSEDESTQKCRRLAGGSAIVKTGIVCILDTSVFLWIDSEFIDSFLYLFTICFCSVGEWWMMFLSQFSLLFVYSFMRSFFQSVSRSVSRSFNSINNSIIPSMIHMYICRWSTCHLDRHWFDHM